MIHTPTSTKTGIVIGGAYTPRLRPYEADPIDHHFPRRRIGRAWRVMGLMALVIAASLVGAALFGG